MVFVSFLYSILILNLLIGKTYANELFFTECKIDICSSWRVEESLGKNHIKKDTCNKRISFNWKESDNKILFNIKGLKPDYYKVTIYDNVIIIDQPSDYIDRYGKMTYTFQRKSERLYESYIIGTESGSIIRTYPDGLYGRIVNEFGMGVEIGLCKTVGG